MLKIMAFDAHYFQIDGERDTFAPDLKMTAEKSAAQNNNENINAKIK